MYYSNIRSQTGLANYHFKILIIALVSTAPIPTAESGLFKLSTTLSSSSNPSFNRQPEVDSAKILLGGRMSDSDIRPLINSPHCHHPVSPHQ